MHTKWEFKIVTEPNFNDFEVSMCEYGNQGWEFAGLIPTDGKGACALIKRRYPPTVAYRENHTPADD